MLDMNPCIAAGKINLDGTKTGKNVCQKLKYFMFFILKDISGAVSSPPTAAFDVFSSELLHYICAMHYGTIESINKTLKIHLFAY